MRASRVPYGPTAFHAEPRPMRATRVPWQPEAEPIHHKEVHPWQ